MGLRETTGNSNAEKRIRELVRAFAVVGPKRVKSLYRLSQRIEEEPIPGDVVDRGVFNGGTAAVLAEKRSA